MCSGDSCLKLCTSGESARFTLVFALGLLADKGEYMGRGILLWMLGVPIPIILLLAMCSH
jgi:hypothetical protein